MRPTEFIFAAELLLAGYGAFLLFVELDLLNRRSPPR